MENGLLLGTVGLWRADLLSRQELSPWLSGLVVHPDHRKSGVGQELQRYILEYCKARSMKELYLYTDRSGYYEKSGWVAFDTGYEYSGGRVCIYRHSL